MIINYKITARCFFKLSYYSILGKILVFSEDDTFDKATQTLALNSSNKILKRSKTLEKAIWKLVRRKKCN